MLATRSAADLGNGSFWRTVWMFLIANAQAIDLAQVGPMIDFVQAIRLAKRVHPAHTMVFVASPSQATSGISGQ